MTLEKFDTRELEVEPSPEIICVRGYVRDNSEVYKDRFPKGYIKRRPDDSIDPKGLEIFRDQKALRIIGEHVVELYGSSKRSEVYLPAGDQVLNATHNGLRFHFPRIKAVLEGKDPDDFWLPPIDFDSPDRYVTYARGARNCEHLYAESVFLPGRKTYTGISCVYDFSRSFPTDEIPTIGISGITYVHDPALRDI
jgi:hypothetical protein